MNGALRGMEQPQEFSTACISVCPKLALARGGICSTLPSLMPRSLSVGGLPSGARRRRRPIDGPPCRTKLNFVRQLSPALAGLFFASSGAAPRSEHIRSINT
jgi:hypothetical protein